MSLFKLEWITSKTVCLCAIFGVCHTPIFLLFLFFSFNALQSVGPGNRIWINYFKFVLIPSVSYLAVLFIVFEQLQGNISTGSRFFFLSRIELKSVWFCCADLECVTSFDYFRLQFIVYCIDSRCLFDITHLTLFAANECRHEHCINCTNTRK